MRGKEDMEGGERVESLGSGSKKKPCRKAARGG